jgi:hypothetical protein
MALGTPQAVYARDVAVRTLYVTGVEVGWARCRRCGDAGVHYTCVLGRGPKKPGRGAGHEPGSMLVLACRACLAGAAQAGAHVRRAPCVRGRWGEGLVTKMAYTVLSQTKDETEPGQTPVWLVRLHRQGAPVQGPTYLLRVQQQAPPYIPQTTAHIDSRLVVEE